MISLRFNPTVGKVFKRIKVGLVLDYEAMRVWKGLDWSKVGISGPPQRWTACIVARRRNFFLHVLSTCLMLISFSCLGLAAWPFHKQLYGFCYQFSLVYLDWRGLIPLFCSGTEASFEVLPRLNKIKFDSGVLDELLFIDMPHECRFPSGMMMLEYKKAIQESVYDQTRVVREGQLRIIFTSELKVSDFFFWMVKVSIG